MVDRCRQFGHAYRQIAADEKMTREKCIDCGSERTFEKKGWLQDKEYAKQHARDWIQKGDPGWDECYGGKYKK